MIDSLRDEVFGIKFFRVEHDELNEFGMVFSGENTRALGPVAG